MKIAITGGNGFIGEKLVAANLALGNEVVVLTRKQLVVKTPNVSYVIADLTNPSHDLTTFVKGVDVLYHCAGEIRDESLMADLHINGTRRLLHAAIGNVARWVQLSSVGVYGKCRAGYITENTTTNPVGTYEVTKYESDCIVQDLASKNSLDYVILRPSTVFGEGMPNMSLARMTKMINSGLFFYIGKMNAQMNYVHVDDVVNALVLCGLSESAKGKTFNLSQSINIEDMIHSLCDGAKLKYPWVAVPEKITRFIVSVMECIPGFPLTTNRIDALTGQCVYDSKKIQEVLGFEFHMSLAGSLNRYSASLNMVMR